MIEMAWSVGANKVQYLTLNRIWTVSRELPVNKEEKIRGREASRARDCIVLQNLNSVRYPRMATSN